MLPPFQPPENPLSKEPGLPASPRLLFYKGAQRLQAGELGREEGKERGGEKGRERRRWRERKRKRESKCVFMSFCAPQAPGEGARPRMFMVSSPGRDSKTD